MPQAAIPADAFHALPPSEMAARVRSFDWSRTPLGPIAAWPQSLRLAVGICLGSRFPMFVWWGPELVNIYNDAYAPILGARHPEALGRPAQAIWGEIWDVVGVQADRVMRRGAATWNERVLLVMERNNYSEETYFTWSYSPILDESGAVGGVFCACTEETRHVLAERERARLLRRIESERARLVGAFAQSPSFLAILQGPRHVFEFSNARYEDLVGRRDLAGRTVREVLPEVEGQGFFEILDRVYETGEAFVGSGMRLLLRREGSDALAETYVDFIFQPLRGAEGSVVGILADGIDVTARHRSEARDRFMLALEDALRPVSNAEEVTLVGAELLASHLEADRAAYAEVEPDGGHFSVLGDFNRGVPSIVGRYAMQAFGTEFVQAMAQNRPFVVYDADSHRPPLETLAAFRQTMIRAVICVPLQKAGKLVAMMAVHQAARRNWNAADVELVEHVASRCYESIQRGRVERTLRESETRFRQLADSMPQIVFAAGPDGHIDYFNRQWYEYTGQPEGPVTAQSWQEVHTEEGLKAVANAWTEALRGGGLYEVECALRRHDGECRWHLGRALPIRDARGRIVRWFGTKTDIHDRKRIEDALAQALRAEQRARSDAEEASRMKDEFLATLSHELRTPLNAILGWSHMLRREGARQQDVARGTEVIERNARAQARIIDDLLDMSRIISGKVRIDVAPLDLAGLVRASVETARPTAEAKQVALHSDLDPALGAEVVGDASRLQQVLWNLLTNAIKFTPRHGSVRVAMRRRNGHVEIDVADTGEGIDPDFLPHVFDRFRQADATTTRRHGGLGLGLSIVKQLVELHGGAVRAASPGAGRGATFTVSLPAAEARDVDRREHGRRDAVPQAPVAASYPGSETIAGKHVLVVDDEEDSRDLLRELLEECRATVTTAASSDEAIRLVRERRFDVLVSDIGMPGEDGHALIRRVRALRAPNGAIPALALTAYARPEDRTRAIDAGFQLHAAKPFEPSELIAMVARLSGPAAG